MSREHSHTAEIFFLGPLLTRPCRRDYPPGMDTWDIIRQAGIGQVARLAGCAQPPISRLVRGQAGLSFALAQRITDALVQLGAIEPAERDACVLDLCRRALVAEEMRSPRRSHRTRRTGTPAGAPAP